MKTLNELKERANTLKKENPTCKVFVVGYFNKRTSTQLLSISFNGRDGNVIHYEAK